MSHGYGYPPPPGPTASAQLRQPGVADMGGQQANVPPWYRMPFFPTSPFYSTRPDVGYQVRYYSCEFLNQAAGSEVTTQITFDLPVRIIAINGGSFTTNGTAITVGYGPLDTWLFRLEHTTGDKLHIAARLASTVVGTAQRPGELGATGYTVDQGGSVTIGVTPLVANLRIHVTLHCLEMRGARNFTP
jgi:hypothetical protein